MFILKIVLLVYSLATFSDAKFEDTLKKCSIHDEKCLKSLFQNIVIDAGKDGIPDLGMPPLNSLKVSNVSVNILDTVKGTFIDGVLEGIGSCVYNKFQIDVEKRITTQDVICDMKMEGSVELSGKNPMIQAVLGTSSVDAYGKGGVKLDKLNFKFETPFHLYKKDDGKIYLRMDDNDVNYLFNIKDASIWSEKMTIGNQDISTKGVDYLNKHMKVIVESFGSIFIDQAAAIYCDLANQFYGALPLNNYIIEDLTPYVQN